MPNFNVHWVVAYEALDAAPEFVRNGATAYQQAATDYAAALRRAVVESTAKTASRVHKRVDAARRDWEQALRASPAYDEMTCFAAYMLGACGPDLWTTPSGAKLSVASHHFDLGHYNRTHRQFEISVGRVAKGTTLQAKAEQAYFSGMAAHVGADTVIHQLVNVSAGAYNLLTYLWNGERGAMAGAKKWNIHNKVEHYWDTYVRHRYLGDTGPIFGGIDTKDFATPRRFLLVDSLLTEARRHPDAKAREKLLARLATSAVTYAVEKPLMFPWLFCDRVLDGAIQPFIYAVVVEKENGAYPADVMYEAAVKEASSVQMGYFTYDETDKLAFFRSSNNTGDGFTSWNYLNYFVCPDLEKVKRFGSDVFYELAALGPFVGAGTTIARRFERALAQAYVSGNVGDLGKLRRFWNLDTGLGVQVERVASDTPKEIITRLSFVHVLEDAPGELTLTRRDPHIPGGKTAIAFPAGDGKGFTLYDGGPFAGAGLVEEEEGKLEAKAYLSRLRLRSAVPPIAPNGESIDPSVFFGKLRVRPCPSVSVATASLQPQCRVEVSEHRHRLTLQLHVALNDLGGGPAEVGMVLYGHEPGEDVAPPWTGESAAWIKGASAEIHRTRTPRRQVGPMRYFGTTLLANLDKPKDLPRKVKRGEWNNVIPWEDHKGSYGRNFAISTGRKNVLHPSSTAAGKGEFDATRAFDYYSDVSPTEHLFFSLFALVKTADGVHEAFSKRPVQQEELDAIKRIDALGFVKIVLFYVIGGGGALQLNECYVDGLRVPVTDAAEA